ncbi:type II secretion system F family protein [Blastococcus haudaquaticus]|uniref:Tight adherence protein B n=1 Tax=Blastococcus haudaquaticus TaxID=1938745 RepID=A0A286H639_9ACTN|nr:type II secretion system F family protein [Blastococcus haudaquaticus]SOE02936.1 tight adherence protein B [Blastococcus haudaquaticus]
MTALVVVGIVAVAGALAIAGVLAVGLHRSRVPLSRLDPDAAPAATRLAGAAEDANALAERLIDRSGRRHLLEAALERAGVALKPADLVVVTGVGAVVAGGIGAVLGGPVLAVLLAALAPLVAKVVIDRLRTRRQTAFADQLDDSLQLMASSLRAGHSVLRAVDAVSKDTEAPTSEEFARVVNETRVGRDLGVALEEVVDRTGSQDFEWVVQAIGIHREVGGNLAEILDRVSGTIRERNQLRRHARSLSAEGRISGIVLISMPFAVFLLVSFVAPGYTGALTGTGTGRLLLALALGLLLVGGLWLRSTVKVKF